VWKGALVLTHRSRINSEGLRVVLQDGCFEMFDVSCTDNSFMFVGTFYFVYVCLL